MTLSDSPPSGLVDRQSEREALTRLVGGVLAGESRVLVLRGEARFDWTHGIPRRKQDTVDGVSFERQRRLSVTFRTVVEREAVTR